MTHPQKVARSSLSCDHRAKEYFLLPYVEGQVESLLNPWELIASSERAGYSLAQGVSRDHTSISSAVADLRDRSGLAATTIQRILEGPGGVGPIGASPQGLQTPSLSLLYVAITTTTSGSVLLTRMCRCTMATYTGAPMGHTLRARLKSSSRVRLLPQMATACSRGISREQQQL